MGWWQKKKKRLASSANLVVFKRHERRRQATSEVISPPGLRQKQRRGHRQCTKGLPFQAQPDLDVFRNPPAQPVENFEKAP